MSDLSSASSSRSSSPEPVSKKGKSVPKPQGRLKDATWDFKPPPGVVLVEEDIDAEEFDWDNVKNDDDLELWLIRVPETVKPKHLKDVQIELPTTSASTQIGSLKRKQNTFDVWNVGDDDKAPVGAEELNSISCLLPRKSKKGKLYPAPKPFARRLVVSAQPAVADVPESQEPLANPPRFQYPSEVLKHKFLPYGSLERSSASQKATTSTTEVEMADATEQPVSAAPPSPSHKKKKVKSKATVDSDDEEPAGPKKKGKKRKGEGDDVETPVPKKSKKSKS